MRSEVNCLLFSLFFMSNICFGMELPPVQYAINKVDNLCKYVNNFGLNESEIEFFKACENSDIKTVDDFFRAK